MFMCVYLAMFANVHLVHLGNTEELGVWRINLIKETLKAQQKFINESQAK